MGIAIVVTPKLVRELGPSRWGIYTIALSLTGMMGLFDFGIGRALTRSVAVKLGADSKDSASEVLTGILALTSIGIAGTLLLALVVDFWTRSALQVPFELQGEVRISLYLLCLAMPLVLLNAALFGVLSAYQRQREINLLNIPLMVLYYVGPLAAFSLYPSLVGIMLVILAMRTIMTYGYWRICLRCLPSLKHARPSLSALMPLLRMGSWMTVSNLVLPLLTYIDRFIIASVVSAAVTGYYVTPNDLASKLYLIPTAITTSAFPAIAASYGSNPENTINIFRRTMVSIASAVWIPALLIVAFSPEILQLWLGRDFASHASGVFRIFGLGIMMASADISPGLLDAIGRAKINAIFSILELLCYVPLLFIFVKIFGLEGAALAWGLRILVDFLVRLFIAIRYYPAVASAAVKGSAVVLLGTALLWLPVLATTTSGKLIACCAGLAIYGFALWYGSMTSTERSFMRSRILNPQPQIQS